MYLGTIKLSGLALNVELKDLIKNAKLVQIENAVKDSPPLDLSKDLAKDLVRNTITTMQAAGQLQYLRSSGVLADGWRILVEIHYYRDRPRTMANLHKDTLGQTLFVNLNYTNKSADAGPEFLLNPPTIATHEEKIATTLPKEFLADLQKMRSAAFTPTIENRDLPANAVVSFVDEAIHHATPLLGHRQVRIADLPPFLALDDDFRGEFGPAADAYLSGPGAPGSVERQDAFDRAFTVGRARQRDWYLLMKLCAGHAAVPDVDRPAEKPVRSARPDRASVAEQERATVSEPVTDEVSVTVEESGSVKESVTDKAAITAKEVITPAKKSSSKGHSRKPVKKVVTAPDAVFPKVEGSVDRPQLRSMMNDKQIDRLLAMAGDEGFRSVSIPGPARADAKAQQRESIVDPDTRRPAPLTRQISMRGPDKLPRVDPATPRRFFRTWVRAVRTDDR